MSIDALAKAIVDGRWVDAESLLEDTPLPRPLSPPGKGEKKELDQLLSAGQTLLQLAVEARYPAFLRRLLDAGADPNRPNLDGDTPLIVSCRGDFAVETGILLEAGADPNYRTESGWTALRCAAKDRNYAAVRILLAKGAIVDTPEPWSTALDAFVQAVASE